MSKKKKNTSKHQPQTRPHTRVTRLVVDLTGDWHVEFTSHAHHFAQRAEPRSKGEHRHQSSNNSNARQRGSSPRQGRLGGDTAFRVWHLTDRRERWACRRRRHASGNLVTDLSGASSLCPFSLTRCPVRRAASCHPRCHTQSSGPIRPRCRVFAPLCASRQRPPRGLWSGDAHGKPRCQHGSTPRQSAGNMYTIFEQLHGEEEGTMFRSRGGLREVCKHAAHLTAFTCPLSLHCTADHPARANLLLVGSVHDPSTQSRRLERSTGALRAGTDAPATAPRREMSLQACPLSLTKKKCPVAGGTGSTSPWPLLLETQRGLASKPKVIVVASFKTFLILLAVERAI